MIITNKIRVFMVTGKTSIKSILDLISRKKELNIYANREKNNEALMEKVGDEFIKILAVEPLIFFHNNQNLTDQIDFDLSDLCDHISHMNDSWKINFFRLLNDKQVEQIEINWIGVYSHESNGPDYESVKIIGLLNTLNVPGKNTWKPDFEWVENHLINLRSSTILKFLDHIPTKSFFGYLFSNHAKRNIRSYKNTLNFFELPSQIDLSDKRFRRVLDYTIRCPLCNAIHHVYLSHHKTHKKFIENKALFSNCKSTREILTIDSDRIYLRCGHFGHEYSNPKRPDFSISAKKYKINTKQLTDEDHDRIYLFIRSMNTYDTNYAYNRLENENEIKTIKHSEYFNYIENLNER